MRFRRKAFCSTSIRKPTRWAGRGKRTPGGLCESVNELQGFYAKLDYIAQFERDLAKRGKLEEFKAAYARVSGRSWDDDLDAIDNLENDMFAKVYAQYFGKSKRKVCAISTALANATAYQLKLS